MRVALLLLALAYMMNLLVFQISAGTPEGEDLWREDLPKTLGALSWEVGAPLLLLFVIYKQASVGLMRKGIMPPMPPKWAIRAHMIIGLTFGALSLSHGLLLMSKASALELFMLALVALLMINGIALKVKREEKVHPRLIWLQRGAFTALAAATLIHVLAS